MSPRDLPLWARGAAAPLLVVGSWWLLRTEPIRSPIGDSVALVALGVIAGSMLRGMHVPIALWPDGPWRRRFSSTTVVAVALAFAALAVLSRTVAPSTERSVDPGTYAVAAVGVVTWGVAWAMVRQRRYAPWFGIALAAGVLPALAVGATTLFRDGLAVGCATGAGSCVGNAVGAFAFPTVVGAATGLVTRELAFRRLLVGAPAAAGGVVIVLAATVEAIWVWVTGVWPGAALGGPWWTAGAAAVAAGSLYALSGSLLASSVCSAAIGAAYGATAAVSNGASGPTLSYAIAVGVVAAALLVAVVRTRGWLAGVR